MDIFSFNSVTSLKIKLNLRISYILVIFQKCLSKIIFQKVEKYKMLCLND